MRFAAQLSRLFLLSCACCISASAVALDTITLQLNGPHAFQFAGYYAAQEKGYFQNAGLQVNLVEALPDSDPLDKVLGGQAQFGIGTSDLVLARAAGKPIVALAVILQHSPYVIYAPQQTNIENVRDLSGKRVMLDPRADELLAYLRKEGMAPERLGQLMRGSDPQDLISGKADAMSGRFSEQPYYFNRAHFAYRIFTPRQDGIDFYGDNLFTSEQELRDHPQRVKAFVEASLRGWRYAKEHPDEIINLILRKYTAQLPRDYLQFESEQTLPLLQPDLTDIGNSNPKRWKHIADVYADAGMLPRNVALDGFIYDPHAGEDLWLYRGIIITVLLLGLISAAAIFIYRMNRRLGRSLSELENLHRREQARNHILELLSKDAPLKDILDAVVKSVEAEDPLSQCSILLMDADGRHLNVAAAPSLPDFYKQAIDGLAIGFNVGSCGTTAYLGKRTIVENILTHPSWAAYKELATDAGLGSCWSEPIVSSSGKVLGTFAIYHRNAHQPTDSDIERIELAAHLAAISIESTSAKQALQLNDLLLSKISAEVPGIIFQLRLYPDGRCCFPFISEAVRKMYGLSPEDLRKDATPFFGFRHPEDASKLEESIHASARDLTRWHVEYRLLLPSQGTRWRLGDALPEKLADGSILWHGFITDITERKSTEERIHHMAQYDVLTDLPNRALFSDRLQQALAIAKRGQSRLALCFLDFDKFKPINDTLGHAIGDVLLKRAAVRMQSCMRESDTVARIGGDEFVVLLPNIETEQDAVRVAEKIRLAIEKPFEVDGHVLNISTSIGIALYPQHGEDEIELSKNADLAMYYAKQSGRNTITLYHYDMQVLGQ